MDGVNPTVIYIGTIVVIILSFVAAYLKIIPPEIPIAILSAFFGHSFTIASQNSSKGVTTNGSKS